MFSTLRSRSGETTLHAVEHNSRGPPKPGMPPRLACGACRQKKLRCSGEKPTCERCQHLGVRCVYAQGRGGSRSGSGATSRDDHHDEGPENPKSSSSKTSSSGSIPAGSSTSRRGDTTVTRDTFSASQSSITTNSEQGQHGWNSTATTSPQFEVPQFDVNNATTTTNNGSGNAHVNSIETIPWTDPIFGDTGSYTGTGDIGAFDMDQFLFSPAVSHTHDSAMFPNADLFSLEPSADMAASTALVACRPSTQASTTSRQDSIMSVMPGSSNGSPAATGSLESTLSRSNTQCPNDCMSSALRSLEVLHQFPAHGASSPRDLLKHIGIFDRHCIKPISQVHKCPTCTRSRQFLLLLVTILDNCVDTLRRIEQTLTDANLLVAESTLTDYGVDSVDDFIRMYSPILMPIRGELERIVEDLLLRFDQKTSRAHQLLSRMEERLQLMLDFS